MNNLLTENHLNRIEAYKSDYIKYGYSPKSLAYPSDRRNIRYYELLKFFLPFWMNKKNEFSILDIGCGFGDVNGFLKKIGYTKYNYLGVDVVEEFIKKAEELYGENDRIRFIKNDFMSGEKLDYQYDYAIASGIYSDVYTEASDNNYELIFENMSRLFEGAKYGIAFNFITDLGDYKREGFAYHSPMHIMEFAYKHTKRVILNNSYFPYECTCIMLKDNVEMNGKVFDSYMLEHEKEFEEGLFVVSSI